MAAPPEDAQIPAAPDAQALQVVPAQTQAQAPVEVNSCFLVSSFGFWRVLFRLPFVLVVVRGPHMCSRLITFMRTRLNMCFVCPGVFLLSVGFVLPGFMRICCACGFV